MPPTKSCHIIKHAIMADPEKKAKALTENTVTGAKSAHSFETCNLHEGSNSGLKKKRSDLLGQTRKFQAAHHPVTYYHL